MWALLNSLRVQAKLAVTVLVADVVFLFFLLTLITAVGRCVSNPAIALVGFFWIGATAFAIWTRGGVVVDAGIVARLAGTQIGKTFSGAMAVFFFIQSMVVAFFFFVPVYNYWSGLFIMPILVAGMMIAGTYAGKKWHWLVFWRAFAAALLFVLAAMVISGFFSGGKPSLNFLSGIWPAKTPAPPPASGSQGSSQTAGPRSGVFTLEPRETINTGLRYAAGDRITLRQLDEPTSYYFVGLNGDREISTREFVGVPAPGTITENTRVWLKGGSQKTRVEIIISS